MPEIYANAINGQKYNSYAVFICIYGQQQSESFQTFERKYRI